jgi:hypothetical protein
MSIFDERKVPAEWAQCRGANHWLEWIPSEPGARSPGIVPIWWRCLHCSTERRDELDASTLELVRRRYVYPDGYLSSSSNGERPSRATWRAAYLRGLGAITNAQAAKARRYRKEIWEETGQ